ncbi:hypothetical protein VTL71DRAFT_7947 [Oculimacula yallundae]|uniref:Peptidase C14 caspase domain-containing protein n=1 Tax=Oculimacula yallundae TaxID=86028 RepID=A0ABR4CW56_9HELO
MFPPGFNTNPPRLNFEFNANSLRPSPRDFGREDSRVHNSHNPQIQPTYSGNSQNTQSNAEDHWQNAYYDLQRHYQGQTQDLEELKVRYNDLIGRTEMLRQRLEQLESNIADEAIDRETVTRQTQLREHRNTRSIQKHRQEINRMERIMGRTEEDRKDWSNQFANTVIRGWSQRHRPQYDNVKVLLVRWRSDDLGVQTEVNNLGVCFEDCYGFDTETFKIPDSSSTIALTSRVIEFLKHEHPRTLLIFYYAGHGRVNPMRGDSVWQATKDWNSASTPSGPIQTLFEHSRSDTLLLYDACHSADTATGIAPAEAGMTELIAAAGCNETAPGPGKDSFSHAMTDILRSQSTIGDPFTVSELHSSILARVRGASDPNSVTTPVHTSVVSHSHDRERCILLAPLARPAMIEPPMSGLNKPKIILTLSFCVGAEMDEGDDHWRNWVLKAPRNFSSFHYCHSMSYNNLVKFINWM